MRRPAALGFVALLVGCGSDAVTTSTDAGGVDAEVAPWDGGSPDTAAPHAEGGAEAGRDSGPEGGRDAGGTPPGLGANPGPNGVTFRVWAPHATAARVVGSFAGSPLAMTAGPGGIFEATSATAKAGDTYGYSLDTPSGTLSRTDPYCRELASAGCTIVDPASFAWTDAAFQPAPRAKSIVYEMHVGSLSVPSGQTYGTFASAKAALPGLADLGVNVVEVLPVLDFGGGPEGWGYHPQLYFAPKASYGTADELRAFVDAAHGLGIGVWLDLVVNHCDGWSQAPLRCFDGDCPTGSSGIYFFAPGTYATTPWGPRPDYTDPQVVTMLVDATASFQRELHGDGFRWDSVSNIRALDGNGTTPGGQALLQKANDAIHAAGGLSVAEDLKGYAAITDTTAHGGFGFDAQWDGFGYTLDAQLALASDASRDLGQVIGALTGNYNGDGFQRVLFVEDHDMVGNGGARLPVKIDGANPTSFAARKRSILGGVLLLTSPGVPMLFQGQEFLATDGFLDPPAPLAAPAAAGLPVRAFYKDMLALRRNAGGGAGGLSDASIEVFHRNDAAKVVAYRRHGTSGEDAIVVVNLMNKAYTEYDVGVADAGPWRVRLDTDWQAYGSDFGGGTMGSVTARAGTKDGKPYTLPLALAAYSAMILTH